MMAGPSVGSAVSPPLFPGIGMHLVAFSQLGDVWSSLLARKANEKLMEKFGLTGQTAIDLSPGSTYQNSKQFQSAPTPKILIWGNETYPQLWKIVGTYALSDSEINGISAAGQVADLYNQAANGEEFQSWVNLPMHGFHQWRKERWQQGRDWMNNDSNNGWLNVIGAQYTEIVYMNHYGNTCSEEYYYYYCDSQPDPQACRASCETYYQSAYTIYHNNPNDGVVTADSQKNIGGNWQGQHLEAPGVNHGEFKDPDRVRDALNWVFDGGYRGDIFEITRR